MSVYLTTRELATRLRVKPLTVLQWAADGVIPVIRINERTFRFDPEEVDAVLKGRTPARRREEVPA